MEEKIIKVEGGFRIIVGSGGGKQKPSTSAIASAREDPNNLRSRDDAVILTLIGEGEILGPPSGDLLKDIYLDETPIKNADGTLNFQNVTVDFRTGTQSQDYIPGFSTSVESEQTVGVQVKVVTGPVTRRVTNSNANALRLRMLVPSLLRQDDKGNITGSEVEFSIQVSTQGGSFNEIARPKISGKTTSSYERAYRLPLSTTGPWDVRVIRITPDSTDTRSQNDLYWQSFVEIIDAKLRYPNSALLGVRISAEQFQNIPKISIKLNQAIVPIPHNYNPIQRSYTGIFNGSMSRGFSNNPAWVFYDLISNNRYGCGRFIEVSKIDVFSLYAIAQYCDSAVSDGKGGLEPRFVCNCYIQSQDDAFKILESITSCFRGMIYQAGDVLTAVQDRPTAPVRAYTRANVVCEYDDSGVLTAPPFNYSGTSLETRYSHALVSYSDPDDFYRVKVEPVEDRDTLIKYGYNQTEITAFGCTSRAQAHRLGRWMLASQKELTQTVTFKVGAEGLLVNPGEVFKILDPLKTISRRGGRIKSTSTTTRINLDDAIAIESGKSYTLSTLNSEGKIVSRTITNSPGTYDFLTPSPAFTESPRHIWMLESNDLQAQIFRCVSVSEVDSHTYEIIGIEYNASIYDAVELGLKLENPPIGGFLDIRSDPQVPSGLTATESLYETIGSAGVKVKVELSWKASPSAFIKNYQVEMRSQFDTEHRVIEVTENLSTVIFDVAPGVYFFRVQALNRYGLYSQYASIQKEIFGLSTPPANVTNFNAVPFDKYATLSWDASPDLDVRVGGFFKIKHTVKKQSFSWADGIELAQVPGIANTATVQLLDGSYLIKAVDSMGNQSKDAAQVVLDNFPDLFAFNAIAETIQEPTFSGIGTNTTVIAGILRLTSLDYFDAQPGMFDSQSGSFDNVAGYMDSFPGSFDSGQGSFDEASNSFGVIASGIYNFNAPVDLGDIYTSRLTANISVYNVDETKMFDRTGGDFDSITGAFDGQGNDNGRVTLQVATSQNGTVYTDFQNFITGDYTARAFKFRILMDNGSASQNIYVEKLQVKIDAPDRMVSGNFITSTSADTTFTFPNAYASTPEIALTIQNSSLGDYIELISKSASGAIVNVRNNLGDRVARTVSYLAKGFGKKF